MNLELAIRICEANGETGGEASWKLQVRKTEVHKAKINHKDFTLISASLYGRRGNGNVAERTGQRPARAECLVIGATQMATVFSVRASAGKGSFSVSLVSEHPLALRVGIPAAPEKGAANRELVFRLEELLGCDVQIIAGKTGRRKTLAAECAAYELVQKVKQMEKQNER